ncbi:helix-turn-helix domain-containing protein [Bdellovibrionota bacterium FG-1]
MKELDSLAIEQANRRLKSIRKALPDTKVRPGWIRYMRQSLSMTLKQLATRTGLSIPTVAQAERGEAVGKVTINTLKTMAQAMDCELIYAFVPKTDLDQLMKKAALKKAAILLSTADVHMTLEDQRVNESVEKRIERLAEKLLKKGDVW